MKTISVKTIGFVAIAGFTLVGCGGGSSGSVEQGNGVIDVVSYLPSHNMTRMYAIGSYHYLNEHTEYVTVDIDQIYIEEHIPPSNFMTPIPFESVRNYTIQYDEDTITMNVNNGYPYMPETIDRHVDISDVRNTYHDRGECLYVGVDESLNINDTTYTELLHVQCNARPNENDSGYKSDEYYKKDLGLVYLSGFNYFMGECNILDYACQENNVNIDSLSSKVILE